MAHTSIRFDPNLVERAKIAAIRSKMTFQALCSMGLERVVAELEKTGGKPPKK